MKETWTSGEVTLYTLGFIFIGIFIGLMIGLQN